MTMKKKKKKMMMIRQCSLKRGQLYRYIQGDPKHELIKLALHEPTCILRTSAETSATRLNL